jgi:drug/metabolite transporter (DMT)-like permease
MILWGGTFPAAKIVGERAAPLSAAFFRFLMASLILAPLSWRSGGTLWPRGLSARGWAGLFLSTLTGLVLYNYFFIKGLTQTEAGRGAVVVALNPALIYLGAMLFFGEELAGRKILGLALSIFGTMWALSLGRPLSVFSGGLKSGDIVMMGCTLSWAAYSLIGKVLLESLSPLTAVTWSCILASLALLPLAVLSGEPPLAFLSYPPQTWLCLGFLGLGGTALGFVFFNRGILGLGPSRAGIFINLVPVFGLIAGALALKEKLGLHIVLGLALSLLGIALIQKH